MPFRHFPIRIDRDHLITDFERLRSTNENSEQEEETMDLQDEEVLHKLVVSFQEDSSDLKSLLLSELTWKSNNQAHLEVVGSKRITVRRCVS